MNRLATIAVALLLAGSMPALAQSNAPTPGSPGNGQVGTGAAKLPVLTSSSGGSPTSLGAQSGSAGGLEVLCLPSGASATQPFFTGTDLSCVK